MMMMVFYCMPFENFGEIQKELEKRGLSICQQTLSVYQSKQAIRY